MEVNLSVPWGPLMPRHTTQALPADPFETSHPRVSHGPHVPCLHGIWRRSTTKLRHPPPASLESSSAPSPALQGAGGWWGVSKVVGWFAKRLGGKIGRLQNGLVGRWGRAELRVLYGLHPTWICIPGRACVERFVTCLRPGHYTPGHYAPGHYAPGHCHPSIYALSLPPHPYWQVCTSSLELPDGLWFFGVCWTMVTVVIMVTITQHCPPPPPPPRDRKEATPTTISPHLLQPKLTAIAGPCCSKLLICVRCPRSAKVGPLQPCRLEHIMSDNPEKTRMNLHPLSPASLRTPNHPQRRLPRRSSASPPGTSTALVNSP